MFMLFLFTMRLGHNRTCVVNKCFYVTVKESYKTHTAEQFSAIFFSYSPIFSGVLKVDARM